MSWLADELEGESVCVCVCVCVLTDDNTINSDRLFEHSAAVIGQGHGRVLRIESW